VKIGYRKIQINGEWFRWDEREEKLKKKVKVHKRTRISKREERE
jgi:hypothetical protein